VRAWIQTRSKETDYRFFGIGTEGEPGTWWRRYVRLSAPEDRTLLVETSDARWRIYVAALEAGRRDGAAPPRAIRNSLLVEGTAEERDVLSALLQSYFDGSLQAGLQVDLSEPLVETAFRDGVLSLQCFRCFGLTAPSDRDACDVKVQGPGLWCGDWNSIDASRLFVAAVEESVSARRAGAFAVLNLMSSPREALELAKERGVSCGVFLYAGGPEPAESIPIVVERDMSGASKAAPRLIGALLPVLAAVGLALAILFVIKPMTQARQSRSVGTLAETGSGTAVAQKPATPLAVSDPEAPPSPPPPSSSPRSAAAGSPPTPRSPAPSEPPSPDR
jgi:hypothetical protein